MEEVEEFGVDEVWDKAYERLLSASSEYSSSRLVDMRGEEPRVADASWEESQERRLCVEAGGRAPTSRRHARNSAVSFMRARFSLVRLEIRAR